MLLTYNTNQLYQGTIRREYTEKSTNNDRLTLRVLVYTGRRTEITYTVQARRKELMKWKKLYKGLRCRAAYQGSRFNGKLKLAWFI